MQINEQVYITDDRFWYQQVDRVTEIFTLENEVDRTTNVLQVVCEQSIVGFSHMCAKYLVGMTENVMHAELFLIIQIQNCIDNFAETKYQLQNRRLLWLAGGLVSQYVN